ncbi:hypothetical protein V6N12_049754 [Hibiscus sabdariffa]|uniref:Uncharacterized protein n=1 Tax=Hibiscus sabdariffa TaxID=183260 RepID=A0ABR2GC54_9ROSI
MGLKASLAGSPPLLDWVATGSISGRTPGCPVRCGSDPGLADPAGPDNVRLLMAKTLSEIELARYQSKVEAVDGDDISFQDHVGLRCIRTLLTIINTSTNEEESSAAMGIIPNLPKDIQINQWLLDSGAVDIIFAFDTDGNRNA